MENYKSEADMQWTASMIVNGSAVNENKDSSNDVGGLSIDPAVLVSCNVENQDDERWRLNARSKDED